MKFFCELDVSKIKGRFILIDMDGPLIHRHPSPSEAATIQNLRDLKARNRLIWCVRPGESRTRAMADLLKIPCIETPRWFPSDALKKILKSNKRPVVMFGENYLVDGMLARRVGATFIKVKTARTYRDFGIQPLLIFLDTLLFNWFYDKEKIT